MNRNEHTPQKSFDDSPTPFDDGNDSALTESTPAQGESHTFHIGKSGIHSLDEKHSHRGDSSAESSFLFGMAPVADEDLDGTAETDDLFGTKEYPPARQEGITAIQSTRKVILFLRFQRQATPLTGSNPFFSLSPLWFSFSHSSSVG